VGKTNSAKKILFALQRETFYIAALTTSIIWMIYWLDCVVGILGAIVITKWALSLMGTQD